MAFTANRGWMTFWMSCHVATLWTVIVELGILVGLGYYFAEILKDPAFELNRFIIRGAYLAVVE